MQAVETSQEYKRDIRRLMISVAGAIGVFGCVLLAIISFAAWSSDRSAVEREQQLVTNGLNRAITRALNELKSVAWWDAAVTNISDRRIDYDFADANFGYFLTDTYAHDEIYILNGEGQPVYAFFGAERQNPRSFAVREADFAEMMKEMRGEPSTLQSRPGVFTQGDYRFLAGGGQGARWSGHIVAIDGRPAIVTAMNIVPNVDLDLAHEKPFMLASVQFIDADFMASLGQALLLPDLALAPEARDSASMASQNFAGDGGTPLGVLTWTTRRSGQVLWMAILPLAVIGIGLASYLSYSMLRRLRAASAELADREAKSRYEAKHDALSGLPNRAYFLEELEQTLAANHARHVSVSYVDIDRFKDINDTMGHHIGDQLIRAVGARLRAHLHPNDLLARIGGDEFAVLAVLDGRDETDRLARAVADALAEPLNDTGSQIRVTASIGIAVAPDHGDTSEALLRHADIALYEAKAQGRDCAVVFSGTMGDAVATRRRIELDLRAAFDAAELDIHYQPLISAATGAVTGVEALIRWRHEIQGDIPPALFVPIAEEAGLMPSIGEWVLRRVFADAARWRDIDVAVNLSPVQFRQPGLITLLEQLVAEHSVSPERIVLEFTEGVLLDTNSRAQEVLDGIRTMGFKTALDDFGSGYSSLAHLSNYRFDKIKIDPGFVSGAPKREAAKSIVQAVANIGRGLGMEIVAEGVETEFDAAAMRQYGCTELQGFFFAHPMPRDEIDAMLRRDHSAAGASPSWTRVSQLKIS